MHPTLAQVIQAFRSAQELAVSTLVGRLEVAMPRSNMAWATQSAEARQELYKRGQKLGLGIRAHGYGVEIKFPDVSIDFDWGDHGEANGFDTWRLWNHCHNNDLFLESVTYDLLGQWIQSAIADGELTADRLLLYRVSEKCA